MNFKVFFCDPIYPDRIELGDIAHDKITDHFEQIDWSGYLQKSKNAKLDDIYFHPTFEAENAKTNEKLGISAVGDPDDFKFNIVYTRTKREKVKSLIGLKEEVTENYLTMIHGQDKNDALDCLKAFTRNDREYLSNKIGQ